MNTLFALLLVLVALGATLYPLRRAALTRAPRRTGRVRELEERYRAALADLQDIELDREVGNLAEPDYQTLRSRYRLRAAQMLAEIDAEVDARTRLQAALGARSNGHAGVAEVPRPLPPPSVGRALVPAAILSAAVVVGIGALYWRLVAVQGQQDPLATLPILHAHTVMVDSTGELWVGHHSGLLRSSNGQAWQTVLNNGDFMGVVGWPDGKLLGLGHDLVWQSTNGGSSWAPAPQNLPGTDVHGAQLVGTNAYAYAVGFGLFQSQDGTHWELRAPALAGNVYGLAALPGAPDVVFLAVDERLVRSLDGGRTWSDAAGAGNLALSGAVRAVGADITRGSLYAATSAGLFQSRTNGSQWTRLPFKSPVMAVGAAGGMVGIVDDRGQFYLSNDGGVTWLQPS